MKKIIFTILAFIMCVCFTGCTQNERVRMYGGSMVVTLDPGQKLIMATWKDMNLWYLTEPAEDGYKPVVKTFKEDSRFGIVQGEIKFIER